MPDSQSALLSYLDFEIEIGLGQGREYPVAARSPAGEARGVLRFPFDSLALESRLKDLRIALLSSGGSRRQVLLPEEQAVRDFGQALFQALFAGEVGVRYAACQERAEAGGQGVRLRLRIQPPEMAVLPWEFLYDERQKEYVCLSTNTPLVRYVDAPQPVQPLAVTPPLRILAVIADPQRLNLPRLEVGREKERLERALQGAQQRGLVELHWLKGATWRDLSRAMRGGPWHIFHFIGHGGFDTLSDEGLVVLEDEHKQPHVLRASELARLLADHRSLRLVVLNACQGAQGSAQDLFSSAAAILVRRRLPAVLAMQYDITDRAAIELSQVFYEALAEGLPVDAAAAEARKAVSFAVQNTLEWGTPVLYMRAADGVLFSVQSTANSGQVERAAGGQRYQPSAEAAPEPRRQPAAKPADPNLLTVTLAPGVTMDFVRIPAGEFLMGSDKQKDSQAYDDELPQHRVELAEYWMAKTPVTVAQFAVFAQARGYKTQAEKDGSGYAWTGSQWETVKGANWQHPSGPKSDVANKASHPVTQVSWDDAAAFCQWASQVSGHKLSLPTEAQWEKAARGADGRIYPWDDAAPDANLCNFNMNVKDTTPVGKYSPQGDSPYGCVDMAGNVWEWCTDWFDEKEYSRRAKSQVRDPQGPASGQYRVVRGGSWVDDTRVVRTASRYWVDPSDRYCYVGLRCARSP